MPAAAPAAASPPARGTAPGLLLIAASTLGLEVALTRVLSVSLWYHFAFLVVSTAVLGFGLSGVFLSLPGRLRDLAAANVHLAAAAYAGSIAASFALCNALPFDPFALLSDPLQAALLPLYSLALTLPFFLSGVTVALLLLRDAKDLGRLYAWDLAGAGAGAALTPAAFGPLGGSGAVLACAAVGALGAVCLALPRGRAPVAGTAALAALCAGLALAGERVLPVRVPEGRLINEPTPVAALLRDPSRLLATRWNALGRVDLVTGQPAWLLLLDGGAAVTRVPDASGPLDRFAQLHSPEWLAFRLGRPGRVLVFGSGGGWEVLGALAAGARQVDAVEVNPAVNDLVRDASGPLTSRVGGLFADPRVALVTDEGRSFLRRSRERYGVIVAAHTISNAASAAGALALSESYTLTAEAFDDSLAHLAPGGYLLITRPELQLGRLISTAGEALARRGLDPSACVAAARLPGPAGRSFLSVLLVRNGPFDAEALALLRAALPGANLEPLLLPGEGAGPPLYRELLSSPDPEAIYRHQPVNLRPATDDRPFFNQHLRWSALRPRDALRVLRRAGDARLALEDAPVAEVALLLFLAQAAVLGGALLLLPLGALRRAGAEAGRGRAALLGYFGAIGLGFMFVELGLVQRFTLFIGPPTVTFAVVVAALLVSSGLGSRLFSRAGPERALPLLLPAAALLTVALAFGAPLLARAGLGWPLGLRAGAAAALIAPLGVLLGAPFPLGMRLAQARAPALLPWLWGVNGLASVLASAGSLLLATAFGFTAVLLCGAAAYLLALLAARGLRARRHAAHRL